MIPGLDFQAGKTPLTSRQNPVIYTVILAALIIIAIAFVIWLFLKYRKKLRETPEFLKSEKERVTKRKDINLLSKKYGLSQQEETVLWTLCRRFKIPNIVYMIQEPDKLSSYFKTAYDEFKKESKEIELNRLFKIKFRLDKIYASSQIIENTYYLTAGTTMYMFFPDGNKLKCKLLKTTKDFLVVQVPEEYFNSPSRTKEFGKSLFSFTSKTGLSYAFFTRLLRYEREPGGATCVLISHSTELLKKIRRNYQRLDTVTPGKFSAVHGKSVNGKVQYEPHGKQYNCTLTNISGGGCRIRSRLPIKENQLICIYFSFDEKNEKAIGKIVKTRKSLKGEFYSIRIHFIKMPLELQNKIMAKVYGYSSDS
ncbi:MAG: PilZ domain-containing protein [Treponema sp.]